jgi:NADH-quinone oxidoreductase subunit M
LNGFVGEFLVFKGSFGLVTWATALACIGLLLTAVFILTVQQRVFHGPLNERWAKLPDLTAKERWLVAPAIALMFFLGVYPQALIGLFNNTVTAMVSHLTF